MFIIEIAMPPVSRWAGLALMSLILLAGGGSLAQGRNSQVLPSPRDQNIFSIGQKYLLTSNLTEDELPALAVAGNNHIWVAWIAYEEGKGDKVKIRRLKGAGASPIIEVTPEFGDYFNPTLSIDKNNRLWVFWSADRKGAANLYCRILAEDKWTKARRLTSGKGRDFNQQACLDHRGRLWLIWQSMVHQTSNIYLASLNDRGLGKPLSVSPPFSNSNNRDPVLAADSRGKLWIAWSAYANRDYEIQTRSFSQGKLSPVVNISRDLLFYDMHPTLAIDGADHVWISWDSIYIKNHGDSGQPNPACRGVR